MFVLHFFDKLPARHPYLLLFHLLASLLHSLDFALVARLFVLALAPFLVSDLGFDLEVLLFATLDLFLFLALVVLDLFLIEFLTLLDQRFLEPLLVSVIALFFLCDFLESLVLLLFELLLAIEMLSEHLALLPLEHSPGAKLILLVLLGLSREKLLVQIALGFVKQHLPERGLVLLAPDPLLMCDFLFVVFRLLDQSSVLLIHHVLGTGALRIIKVNLGVVLDVCCPVKSAQQLLIVKVFALLLIETVRVFVIVCLGCVVVRQVLGAAFQLLFHFEVNYLGVIDADRALHSFGSDHFVNKVDRLLGKLDLSDRDLWLNVRVDELQTVLIVMARFFCHAQKLGLARRARLNTIEA